MARWIWYWPQLSTLTKLDSSTYTAAANQVGSNSFGPLWGPRCPVDPFDYASVGTQIILAQEMFATQLPTNLVISDLRRMSSITNRLNQIRVQRWTGAAFSTIFTQAVAANDAGIDRNIGTQIYSFSTTTSTIWRIVLDFNTSATNGLIFFNRAWLCTPLDPGRNPENVQISPLKQGNPTRVFQDVRTWLVKGNPDTYSFNFQYKGLSNTTVDTFRNIAKIGYATVGQSATEPLWGNAQVINVKIDNLIIRKTFREVSKYDVSIQGVIES